MSTDQAEGEHSTEVVPAAVSADLVPADPVPAPVEPARVTYQDITRVPGERLADHPAVPAGQAEHPRHAHPCGCAAVAPRPLPRAALPAVPGGRVRLGHHRYRPRDRQADQVVVGRRAGRPPLAGRDRRQASRLDAAAQRSERGPPQPRPGAARRARGPGRSPSSCSAKYAPWWCIRPLWVSSWFRCWPGLGGPPGMRIVGTAIVPPDYSPPTHEIITRALGAWASRRSTPH